MTTKTLAIVSAGFSRGAPRAGSELRPSAILGSGLLDSLRSLFPDVYLDDEIPEGADLPHSQDLDFAGMKNLQSVSAATRHVSEKVESYLKAGSVVLTLGGDHSNAIGSLTGSNKGIREQMNTDIAVICVDAHVSINTPETSPSGNIHGMPLAFATGVAKVKGDGIFDWIQKEHLVNTRRLVYIGTRDVDEKEMKILEDHGIKVFNMEEIRKFAISGHSYHTFTDRYHRNGIEKVMEELFDYIGTSVPVHLSCDIDVLDPEWAPSAGHLVPGGLSLAEGQYIARRVHATGRLAAMDLVEVNPTIDLPGVPKTVGSACILIKEALGATE
ncbi:unnamed protein product [Penicillium olsonii]|uniref:Arginase n=1 Tax=Penicillium olsonii TaxID=99116 RepID=A0A9W4N8T1_PENOL|nr:unnamed protein product [Penicillium olsonii]CAG8299207.1 unnamed protein product [Penicillium olsonii]